MKTLTVIVSRVLIKPRGSLYLGLSKKIKMNYSKKIKPKLELDIYLFYYPVNLSIIARKIIKDVQ